MVGIVPDVWEDVSDPSDWKNTKYPDLANLDSLMRCQICKEFLQAPVLTTCDHIFCSMCIRRTISNTNKCPICSEETYESGLRKVLLLDSIVRWFENKRPSLIESLQIDQIEDSVDEDGPSIKEELNRISENAEALETASSSSEQLAECPVCGTCMNVNELQEKHIEECLGNAQPSSKETKSVRNSPNNVVGYFKIKTNVTNNIPENVQLQNSKIRKKKRLPNLDTSLSFNKLKEKMNSLKLPVNGNKTELENRMREYINLYNSNLDSIHPVSERLLIDKLRKWEALNDRKANLKSGRDSPPINADENTIKRQKKEHVSWNRQNSGQYMELIAFAKLNMQKLRNKEQAERNEKQTERNEKQTEKNKEENDSLNDDSGDAFSDLETELIS
ncbi:uncharacterized protein C5L36_0D05230 [Pichia kudriavzevii]|uniref:Postreplication repair E3 ubiquitin-protein ligase RAD18 n=1 Tax=Pichia kudriavzevii TaxID=4909 RepID=A0A2U9R8U4_PICKU|nr:uncharacterized protein C5L36_0D05230 [Pichia kudriavzevii]AWU77797.1 hypothetical protein C5L36_0D05230 [Pichia kudriavzevii]